MPRTDDKAMPLRRTLNGHGITVDHTETLDEYGRILGCSREALTDRELLELIDDKLDELLAARR